jgi:hypothetical protein
VIPRAVVFIHENRNGSAKMKARQPGLAFGDGLLAHEQPNKNAWLRGELQRNLIEITIGKQWIVAMMPPEPCNARRPGAALLLGKPHWLNLNQSDADKIRRGLPHKNRALICPTS